MNDKPVSSGPGQDIAAMSDESLYTVVLLPSTFLVEYEVTHARITQSFYGPLVPTRVNVWVNESEAGVNISMVEVHGWLVDAVRSDSVDSFDTRQVDFVAKNFELPHDTPVWVREVAEKAAEQVERWLE